GLSGRQGIGVYLVNEQGYWLQGPTPQESWAWQLDAPQSAFKRSNPALWRAMQQSDAGRYSDASGDWAFRRYTLADETLVDQNTAVPRVSRLDLRIVVHSSLEQATLSSPRWQFLLAALMAVVMFLAIRYGWQTLISLIEEDRQTRELHAANRALLQANDNLRSVQADLARAERLSSLGLMVAGVAHELNTPLGSANLSLSTLQQALATLLAQLDSGLRRSDLDRFLSSVQQAVELTQAAIQRAARLVQRFKQVAVDRTTMERRQFELAEIILDADPRLRNWDAGLTIALRLDLQAGLWMNSYPGPLEQVIANLLGNALAHAFQGRDGGTITIRAAADGPDHAIVTISDNGVGIDSDNLGRVFDPFFTTSRHAGGTGLGLHISSQLVAEVLGGTIKVQNIAVDGGTGAMFTLRLPRDAPAHHPAPQPAPAAAKAGPPP
ncbi:MAG: sensor histidine kinase, partial [Pollutimonas bauzanensis]